MRCEPINAARPDSAPKIGVCDDFHTLSTERVNNGFNSGVTMAGVHVEDRAAIQQGDKCPHAGIGRRVCKH